MDAFYASVEQRDNPQLRGKPVAVGGSSKRGVVAAASYEARKFGVRSAMPSITAARKCPELVFVKPRFDAYRAVSRQIHDIFSEHTSLIEPLSLDEAYLDVTTNKQGLATATEIAENIRAQIFAVTGLTASAGVSYNKFLAKIASDQRKPNGLFVITPKNGPSFVETLPIAKFHGVGPATATKMEKLGIRKGLDLRGKTLPFLKQHFGKSGTYFYWVARGIDRRQVRPDRVRKSIGAENTVFNDITKLEDARQELAPLVQKVWEYGAKTSSHARTITLKIRFNDFVTITRSRTIAHEFSQLIDLEYAVNGLIENEFPFEKPIRLLGVTLSNLSNESEMAEGQLDFGLFEAN